MSDFAVDGFHVVPDFVDGATCNALIARARELVDAFEPTTISIFTTNEQTRTSDDYFLESGNDVRFFFEEVGVRETPERGDAKAINKIGHALHDLDPVFAASRRAMPSGTSSRQAYTLHFVDDACHWCEDNWLRRTVKPVVAP